MTRSEIKENKNDSKVKKHALTKEEIREKLMGYMPVPRKHWGDLSRGDHIRWVDKKGEFYKGGFLKFYFEKDGKKMLQTESLLAGSRFDRYYATSTICLDDIQMMYRKVGLDYYIARAQLLAEISKLRAEIRQIKSESSASVLKK
jgi:hypothetical protein